MSRFDPVIKRGFKVISQSGSERCCLCPFHKDRSGHLYINAVSGLYLCHVCGAKGTVAGKTPPPADLMDLHKKLAEVKAGKQDQRFKPERWLQQFDMDSDYWTVVRKLTPAVITQFRLGFDPFTNRATLPFRDFHGNLIGVTYRRLDDFKPKYTHPEKTPVGRHLFGAWLLEDQKTVAITEGQIDAVRCWEQRIPALATFGSKITVDQVKVLQRLGIHKVVVLYDNDNAGRKGTLQVYESMKGSGIQVVAGWYRPYWLNVKDPDGLNGPRLRKFYHSAVDIPKWAEHAQMSMEGV